MSFQRGRQEICNIILKGMALKTLGFWRHVPPYLSFPFGSVRAVQVRRIAGGLLKQAQSQMDSSFMSS